MAISVNMSALLCCNLKIVHYLSAFLHSIGSIVCFFFFFLNDPAPPDFPPLPLPAPLRIPVEFPLCLPHSPGFVRDEERARDIDRECLLPFLIGDVAVLVGVRVVAGGDDDVIQTAVGEDEDRKSTRLNSSHLVISYAVFCLK